LSQDDIDSSLASLRGTLKSLQSSLFAIFNSLVRASTESREAVLDYFTRVVALNVKRGGMQVDPNAVGTDSFLANIQAVLLRFAEPFMDARYSKVGCTLFIAFMYGLNIFVFYLFLYRSIKSTRCFSFGRRGSTSKRRRGSRLHVKKCRNGRKMSRIRMVSAFPLFLPSRLCSSDPTHSSCT